ncbi:phenylacetate--CoA ligase family protein [Lentzea sp. NPDC058450]|uniref:phenylacetate--CoA ligase family protein n=1 Tax=Lentzea sp. NPDC058450 TaxID=3346505 RepID=UPI0036658142
MLINTRERLDTLTRAQDEIRSLFRFQPPSEFYQAKLAEAWQRAAKAAAYGCLPEFSEEAFSSQPVTTKEALKNDPWSFVVTDLGASAKYYETTGTSGQVTPTPRLFEDIAWNAVSVEQAWRRVLSERDRVAILLPSDIVPVADLVVGVCELLDVPHSRVYPFATGISDWDRLTTLWRSLRPTVVFVAPGLALQLTRLLKQRGHFGELSESVHTLMLLGEVSTPALRARLGEWWQATAYDASYGSTETGTLAATCEEGGLHLLTSTNYFEIASGDEVKPLSGDCAGRLVVTPLNLHARPLLRFDTGDEVVVGGDCACDSAAPLLSVRGRSTDVIQVHQRDLTVRAVEDVVYHASSATGYLIELDESGARARLLLERDVHADRSAEAGMKLAVDEAMRSSTGLVWDEIVFVNSLPQTTKSGGSQKSWKRSNIRIVAS